MRTGVRQNWMSVVSFLPSGLGLAEDSYSWLTPWAAFCRRFAASGLADCDDSLNAPHSIAEAKFRSVD
jgi:hypothetical protein